MEVDTGQVLKAKLRTSMNKVSLGVFLCLFALILLHKGRAILGIVAFVIGIALMNGWRRPRR